MQDIIKIATQSFWTGMLAIAAICQIFTAETCMKLSKISPTLLILQDKFRNIQSYQLVNDNLGRLVVERWNMQELPKSNALSHTYTANRQTQMTLDNKHRYRSDSTLLRILLNTDTMLSSDLSKSALYAHLVWRVEPKADSVCNPTVSLPMLPEAQLQAKTSVTRPGISNQHYSVKHPTLQLDAWEFLNINPVRKKCFSSCSLSSQPPPPWKRRNIATIYIHHTPPLPSHPITSSYRKASPSTQNAFIWTNSFIIDSPSFSTILYK